MAPLLGKLAPELQQDRGGHARLALGTICVGVPEVRQFAHHHRIKEHLRPATRRISPELQRMLL